MNPLFKGEKKQNFYLLGICGTAMASLAGMLKEAGYIVSGSDAGMYPPMSTLLQQLEIPVHDTYSKENLAVKPDFVVVGNAIARGNEELEMVLDLGIPYGSMPEVVRHLFLTNKTSIVVAGTHGKTTTSSIMAWALENLGTAPSFLIGGIPLNFKTSYKLGDGNFFVLEGDEYDTAFCDKSPKFFHYRPTFLILNPIEYDHADIYPDLESILLQFKRLVNIIPSNGFIVINQNCRNSLKATEGAFCRVESVGFDTAANWQAVNIVVKNGKTMFDAIYNGKKIGGIVLNVHSKYNILNSLSVCSMLHHLGYPWEGIKSAMERFLGVERRMTLKGEVDGVKVFDDFAHHPTAISETIKGARMVYPENRIIAVFEPRSWSCRKNIHQKAMERCFDEADIVIIADVYKKDLIEPEKRYKPQLTVDHLKGNGKEAYFIPSSDEIVAHLMENKKDGDVVIFMSNGGFDNIHKKFLEKLKNDK